MPAVLRGEALDDCATMFAPPVPEFAVQRITVSATRSTPYQLTEAPSAAVLLCVGGKGEAVVKDSDDGETAFGLRSSAQRQPSWPPRLRAAAQHPKSQRWPVEPPRALPTVSQRGQSLYRLAPCSWRPAAQASR